MSLRATTIQRTDPENRPWTPEEDECHKNVLKIAVPLAVLLTLVSCVLIALTLTHHLGPSSLHSMNLVHLPPSPVMNSIFHNYSYI